MKCPFCGHLETQVVETRVSEDADFVRRRRQCGACDKRFTTYERPDVNFPVVVKKDGSRADFDSTKVRASMLRRQFAGQPVGGTCRLRRAHNAPRSFRSENTAV